MSEFHTVLWRGAIEATSPDTLFLAAKIADQFGPGPSPAMTIPELCRNLGLSAFRGRRAIRNLTQLKLLSIERQFWTSYPSYSFQLRFDRLAGPATEYAWPHEKRAKQLLLWGEYSSEEHPHQLPIPLRVLLLILFAHATPTGVVEGLGHHTLAKRTGQTPRQIGEHLKKLAHYGYIRWTIEGGNFEGVLGRRTSVHLLNLQHKAFSGDAAGGFVGIYDVKDSPEDPVVAAARNVHIYVDSGKSRKAMPKRAGGASIAQLARKSLRAPEVAYLRWLIRQLASDLLTEHSSELIPEEPYANTIPENCRITEQMILEVYQHCDRLIPTPDEEPVAQEPPQPFIDHILAVYARHSTIDEPDSLPKDGPTPRENLKMFMTSCTVQLALQAAKALGEFTDLTADDYSYLLLPKHRKRKWESRLAVYAMPKEAEDSSFDIYFGPVYLVRPRPPNSIALTRSDGGDLTMGYFEGAGLLTLPVRFPSLKREPRTPRKAQDSDT